ncbi:MAG: T9SS type A sorting domain-containing protein, partial [Bacteroidota bacterium]
MYLSSLSDEDEALNDFVTIQSINLNRIKNISTFIPTNEDLTAVYTIARKAHPYAGYAKALYFMLTDEILSSELPDFSTYSLPLESKGNSKLTQSPIQVFPNPFSKHLNILSNNQQVSEIRIYNSLGQLIYFDSITESSKTIHTSNWNTGLYIVEIRNHKNLSFKDKFILTD